MEKQLNEQEEMKGTELSSTGGDKQTRTGRGEQWLNPMEVLTGILAVATIAYVVVSVFLWKVTQTSVELTRESLKLNREAVDISQKAFSQQYRPYLGVNQLEMERGEGDTLFKIVVPVKNFGAVPAQNIDIKMGRLFDGVPTTPVENGIGLSNRILFPQDTFKVNQIWVWKKPHELVHSPTPEKIEFEIQITYEGIGGHIFHTYEKWDLSQSENKYTLRPAQQIFK